MEGMRRRNRSSGQSLSGSESILIILPPRLPTKQLRPSSPCSAVTRLPTSTSTSVRRLSLARSGRDFSVPSVT